MKPTAIALLIALLACPAFSDATARSWLCIEPLGVKLLTNRIIRCGSGNLSLRVDLQQTVPWPREEGLTIQDLGLTESHLAVAICDGQPLPSFRFEFSTWKNDRPCLSYADKNDGYEGLRLSEMKRKPWCKCKGRLQLLLLDAIQRAVAPFAQVLVQHVIAIQKRQHRRAALFDAASRSLQTLVIVEKFQRCVQSINRPRAPVGQLVNFRQIQIELRFRAL